METEIFAQEPDDCFIARMEDEASFVEGLTEAAEAAQYERIARLTGSFPF